MRDVLRDFGVTAKETEIYVFLAKHGALKGGEISKRAKTHKALVYRILASLQNKGLVTPTLEAPARFAAVNFETVIDLNIKNKREEAALLEKTKKELMSYWKGISETASEQTLEKFAVIEGSNKIYSRISQMIKNTKVQLCGVASVPNLILAEKYGVLDSAFIHPLRSKLQFRFLTELNKQNLGDVKSLLKKIPKSGFNFKGRNPDLGLSLFPRMVIRDSEEILFFITSPESGKREEDEVCLWTNSKALVQAFKAVFEDLWSNATDIMARLAVLDSGETTSNSCTITNEVTASIKFSSVMNSAKTEIILMTSSIGLVAFSRSALLKRLTKKGVVFRIMAPIVNENLEAAEQLSKNCDVRHVPMSYLETILIDGKYLFQFKNPKPDQEEAGTWPNFESTYYSDDSRHLRRILTLLNNVWKDASMAPAVTLESFRVSSSNTISVSESGKGAGMSVSSRVLGEQRDLAESASAKAFVANRITGHALIQPPSCFSMPNMVVEIHHYQKQSEFGEGKTLEVYLNMRTPKGHEYIPVAIVETNPHPGVILGFKKIYAGTPAAENIQLVKPDQLQARLTGKNFFAGWTVNIPLPPISKSLPPSCLLFEGYGSIKSRPYTWLFPSGFKGMIDWNGYDAFVTFLDPTWRYSGPGTQGEIGTDVSVAAFSPASK